MRKNSEKQTAASVTNGNKSHGPTSREGKETSKLNALKNGLFSRDIVVAAAGERVEDFDLLKAAVFGSVQPGDAVDVMLAEDLVENWWRRQRVRRSETAELKSRLENLKIHQIYLRSDEIEALKLRFVLLVERCQVTNRSTASEDPNEIAIELEKARGELAATSLGLEFLIEKVEAVKLEVESRGQMSDASLGLLRACIGLTHDFTPFLTEVNRFNQTESAKAAAGESEGPLGSAGPSDEVEPHKGQHNRNRRKKKSAEWSVAKGRTMLISTIGAVVGELKVRRRLVELVEKSQNKARLAAAVSTSEGKYDRFSRAETTYDRRFYRALAALLAKRQV